MNETYKPMSGPMRLVFWFVVFNAYAGAAVLILFPADTQSKFFWTIAPPINARLFGVLYLAAGSVVLHALFHGRWERARYLTAMVPAFTGLILLTTLLHLDRFDKGFELFYWLIVYVVAPLAGVLFYLQHERGGANWDVVERPVARQTRRAAVVAGATAAVVVVFGFGFPRAMAEIWPWTISPLMVRVFLSWLSAFAVGLLWFARDRDWGRLRPVAALLVATGVLTLGVLLTHRDELEATAWLFAVGIGLVGLLGIFMFWRQRDPLLPARPPSPS